MKCIYNFIFFIVLLFSETSFAQTGNQPYYHGIRLGVNTPNLPTSPESVGYSNTGGNMNVVYHRIDWTVNPNDGIPDNIEGQTTNRYKLPGIIDSDRNGLDNRFDYLTSTSNIKGTSYNIGNGGFNAGDASPGARGPVQKKNALLTDRDWRFVGTVLPVNFLQFTSTLLGDNVRLNWTIITPKTINHFEIERSIDNTAYVKAGAVNEPVNLNLAKSFSFLDDITSVNNDIIYYRLKVIGKLGKIRYSNILVVRRIQTRTTVTNMPNPVNDYVLIRCFVENESDITFRLLDNLGKTVVMQHQKAFKGNNTMQLNGLSRYSSGVYSLQVLVNGEVVTEKLILAK